MLDQAGSVDDRNPTNQGRAMPRPPDAKASRRSLILRTIYVLCLLGATYNHWYAIYYHGLHWDYGGFPKGSATFWTALAFFDPAAVILLFARPNVGVGMTVCIIVMDVIHNVWIQAHYFPPLLQALAQSPMVIEQIIFMLFVLLTSPFAWTMKRQTAA
ncbi:hypothetical protein QE385_003354 [Sphingomonas sp. SORGH_AS 950]|uniref:hypothetical protein n=1 Tax=Sphingomonas sp. SORGH_AS_0950 TaxID=3041792 RepID=UPI0027835F84|nr:hypothetical protein [Sphingomonas sp. SORGH_AS_0950]MDQ1159027.1 hypothetical protein [Sphingomonas sp. SORGH_AS_0950]